MKILKYRRLFVVAILLLLVAINLDNRRQMTPSSQVPYFSAAANYEWGKGMRYDTTEVRYYRELSQSEKENYRFEKSSATLVDYHYNSSGYMFCAWIARNIFFWQGDVRAIKSLQIMVHCMICVLMLISFRTRTQKLLFLFLYCINPLIIQVVTFPFYHFWTFLPGAIFALYFLNKKIRFNNWVFPIAIFMACIFLIRPTVFFIIILFFVYFAFRESKWKAAGSILLFAACTLFFTRGKSEKHAWHATYIGLGAWQNKVVSGYGDTLGVKLYQQKTGTHLSSSNPEDNNYNDSVAGDYQRVLRNEFFNVAKEHPFLVIRNATLNFFGSYGIGYFVGRNAVNIISVIVGFIFFVLLLIRKKFWIMAAIGLNSLSFTPYTPPTFMYMFGGYLLIATGVIILLEDFGLIRRPKVKPKLQENMPQGMTDEIKI